MSASVSIKQEVPGRRKAPASETSALPGHCGGSAETLGRKVVKTIGQGQTQQAEEQGVEIPKGGAEIWQVRPEMRRREFRQTRGADRLCDNFYP